MITTDIVVVGAGCVGLTAALGLAQNGFQVTVLDQGSGEVELTEPQARVSAISAASENIFKSLNVWQEIDHSRSSPYSSMKVWEKDSFGKIEFDSTDIGESRLGHIIENNNIRNGLIKVAQQTSNVELKFNAEIANLHNDEQQVLLTLADGTPVMAKLVVAADGANSWVRKQLNTPLTFSDYDHHAIVATVKTSEAHEHCARQAFLPTGPVALLPLWQSDMCSIVWSTEPEHAKQLLAVSDDEFSKALTAATDSVLGKVELVSQRHSFPLTMRYAQEWLNKRVVLLGDAAHTIHPLAGLGMNLGLLDAACLADVLNETELLADQNLTSQLRKFERWRKADAQEYIAAMAGLKSLFDGSNKLKKLIRGVGLSITNKLPLVKDKIIHQATGLNGVLPNLAKVTDSI